MQGPLEPAFILVRPQMGENIGSAARAMWNFGLSRMRLVDPRDGWPNTRAVAMASGAGRVLDNVQVYPDLTASVGDCTYVYATTARPRDLTKTVFSPEEAARDMARRVANGERVACLFGPERTGLLDALEAVGRLPDDLEVGLGVEQGPDRAAKERLVVGQQDADGGAGHHPPPVALGTGQSR